MFLSDNMLKHEKHAYAHNLNTEIFHPNIFETF